VATDLLAVTAAPLLGEPLPVELMNTIHADRDGVHDELRDAAGLAAWLRAVSPRFPAGPAAGRPSHELTGQFRDLRDGLRTLAASVTSGPGGGNGGAGGPGAEELAAAVLVVNEACARSPLWSRLDWAGPPGPAARTVRSAGRACEAALSWIAEEAVLLFTGPQGGRLRACPGPGCVLYFVRAHPRREWCSAVCGNRARVARHYQRHRAGGNTRASGTAPGQRDLTAT
jgi:predicted RNA-binding Zn ribbon-like protein